MEAHDVIVGLAVLAGLFGTVLLVIPGLSIEVGAVFVWALIEQTSLGWVVAFGALVIAALATWAKYLVPGRRMKTAGVPMRVLLIATIAALIGFFVVPVIGAPLGFVGAIYLLEISRVGRDRAWPTTKESLKAVGLSVGIEFSGGVLIALVWAGAALFG